MGARTERKEVINKSNNSNGKAGEKQNILRDVQALVMKKRSGERKMITVNVARGCDAGGGKIKK